MIVTQGGLLRRLFSTANCPSKQFNEIIGSEVLTLPS